VLLVTGPVSRIDRPPPTGARRVFPARFASTQRGVLPSRALLGDLANADPELLRRYPDVLALEAALATRLGVAPERLLVTAGADEAIDRACRAFLEPGRAILLADPSSTCSIAAACSGCDLVPRAVVGRCVPIDAFVGRLDALTAVVAVVSPNNPTGSVAS